MAVAVMAILVSTVAVSMLAVVGNIDARTIGSDSGATESSSGSGFYTSVCGPDPTRACQTSAGE